jgi:hypothetical protein
VPPRLLCSARQDRPVHLPTSIALQVYKQFYSTFAERRIRAFKHSDTTEVYHNGSGIGLPAMFVFP